MIAVIAAVAALFFMCWLLFTLAVYALPFFVGLSAAMLAYETNAGVPGAIVVGFVAGILALVLGQRLYALSRSPALRIAIAALYAAPATLAGYYAVYGVTALGSPTETWRTALALAGAAIIGLVAWNRAGALADADLGGPSAGLDTARRFETR